MSVHGDVLRCQKHCPGAPGPAQLALTVCRRSCVPLSQCRGPTRVAPELVPDLSSLKKEVRLVGGLSGRAACHQGVRSRSWTDTGYAAFAGGHAVQAPARCSLPARLPLISAPGPSVAPGSEDQTGIFMGNQNKGQDA